MIITDKMSRDIRYNGMHLFPGESPTTDTILRVLWLSSVSDLGICDDASDAKPSTVVVVVVVVVVVSVLTAAVDVMRFISTGVTTSRNWRAGTVPMLGKDVASEVILSITALTSFPLSLYML